MRPPVGGSPKAAGAPPGPTKSTGSPSKPAASLSPKPRPELVVRGSSLSAPSKAPALPVKETAAEKKKREDAEDQAEFLKLLEAKINKQEAKEREKRNKRIEERRYVSFSEPPTPCSSSSP